MGFDISAFQKAYEANGPDAGLTEFWTNYDKEGWSMWRCTYDYPDDTENLDGAIEIVTNFIKNCASIKGKCQLFGVMHTLTSFEIEGLFLFEGPDPEPLFGTNEDTSWFSWNQIGPDASDAVKAMVQQIWGNVTQYNGKDIKDTQTFFETSPSSLKAEAAAAAAEEEAAAISKLSEAVQTQATVSGGSSSGGGNDASTGDKNADASGGYDRWSVKDPETIDYGYLSKTGLKGIQELSEGDKSFYITTAINYTNGPAHMGHAYEAATSDVIARFQRLKGTQPVYFVTGSDEHGQKIANTAADQGKEPIEICDKYVIGFQSLNQRILISNDDYIRTTSDRHKRVAKELWKRCNDNGDIYLDSYSGWYNIREETFVTDNDAQLNDFKDPTSGQPLKRVEEESYFFKMSAYKDRLIKHIEDNEKFIQPEKHRNQILARLSADELRDLSISRTTFKWGIPVPEGFNDNHVLYVWLDALSNYLTGVNGLGVNDDSSQPGLEKFWPANVHIIGKDILWFHTVIWPCLLMSANIPLAKTVFAHGFVNDKEGKKMSKSMGNVVDPHDMLDKFHVDTFRWYLCKEAPYGGELSFSEQSLRDMHNADLCDTFGNVLNRAIKLCQKDCKGVVPDVAAPANIPIPNLGEVIDRYCKAMDEFDLQGGASIAIQGFRDVNKYFQDEAPWLKKGDEHLEFRRSVIRAGLEAIYALSHLLLPFLPIGCKQVFTQLGTEPTTLKDLNRDCRNLKVGTPITVAKVLYEKSIDKKKDEKKETHEEAQRRKKEKKAAEAAASKKATEAEKNQPEFTKMDIRVGKIVKVWNHETADKLFCEQIDVGEESGPREIASGLRGHYTLEEMQDRLVLVVCNLKAAKIVGFTSNGMVLAAKGDDGKTVELVTPPEGSKTGERVYIEGLSGEPYSSTQCKKKKTWNAVSTALKTGEGGVATWDGKVIQTSAGPCKAASLVGAPIS